MSTHRYFDRICTIVLVLSLLITVVFSNGEAFGLQIQAKGLGYEDRLFSTDRVHTIDLVIDDWEGFLETAQSEAYTVCSVVIDGENIGNVGIRGKGNTSLSSVSAMGSQRYSFKLEFDQYTTGKTYYGLDKLSLNNLIQDTTYMKDYLTYRMMAEFGAAAPLCSYVWITVNGEDWGLYLAVEGVEDGFLQRNYGADAGELYKPDSMNMGGGRGNGKDFVMDDSMFEQFGQSFGRDSAETTKEEGQTATDRFNQPGGMEFDPSSMPSQPGTMPEGFDPSAMGGMNFDPSSMPSQPGAMPEGFDPSAMGGMNFDPSSMPEGFTMPGMDETDAASSATMSGAMPEGFDPSSMEGFEMPFGGGGFGMGSSDVKLQYVDDDPGSYSTIFNSAKTIINAADQARLIESLKALSSGDVETALDMDAVLRYFVVHNFVVNGDSYTGSMIHNYYLYEEDGKLSMLPWDYNLAYGTFQGGNANSAVNDDIDSPLSVSGSGDRPMVDWIFQNEAYTELYHQYFAEFLQTVDAAAMVQETKELIAPYVEQDPTAFYSMEEFETGTQTMLEFCTLRTESIQLQLSGSEETVDASHLNLSDMGSMGGGMGGGFGFGKDRPEETENAGETTPPDPMQMPDRDAMGQDWQGQMRPGASRNSSQLPLILGSVAVLLVGLVIVWAYGRKRS